IFGMLAAIGVDVANLHVRFDKDGYLTGREKKLDGIWLAHDSRHSGRNAIRRRTVFGRVLLIRLLDRRELRCQQHLLRRTPSTTAHFPHSDELGQFSYRRPGAPGELPLPGRETGEYERGPSWFAHNQVFNTSW